MIRVTDINPAPHAAKLAAARATLDAIGQPAIEPQPLVDTTKPKLANVVVHAVVHADTVVVHAKRSGDRHKPTDERRAYKAEHERKRRAKTHAAVNTR
jgi:hypothetical protein